MAGGWPGPLRRMVGVKLDEQSIAWIDQHALDEGLTIRGGEPNRSEMIRRLLNEAIARRTEQQR